MSEKDPNSIRPDEPREAKFVTDKDAAHFVANGREQWQNRAEEDQQSADYHTAQAKKLREQGIIDPALAHEQAAESAQHRVTAAREILETVEDERLIHILEQRRTNNGERDTAKGPYPPPIR